MRMLQASASAFACAALAFLMAATPVMAATPETALPDLAIEVSAGFTPAPPTEEELSYTHHGLYDAVPAGEESEQTWRSLASYNKANADTVFSFLCGTLGMNRAQACGVMASIYRESRFEPTACNAADTNGLTSYGLCQWNGERYDTLRSWCAEHGYDYTTLNGQLHYLQYEITETWEKRIWTVTDDNGYGFGNAPETMDGAYQAGYCWTRYFGRGDHNYWDDYARIARDEFWPLYGGSSVSSANAQEFVTRLYQVCLGRKPDTAGLNDWVSRLTSGRTTGTEVAAGFVFSPEFQRKNYCNTDYVKQLYRAFLGRESDASGLKNWVTQLERGKTREEVFNGFALSSEFAALCKTYGIRVGSGIAVPQYGTVPHGSCSVCGAQDGITAFVTRLYQVCLNRAPDTNGLNDWTNRLWNHTATGRSVAAGFFFSKEFTNKGYDNATYIEYLYNAFFGRASDQAGKSDWLNRMARGMSRQQVLDGFAGSDEFRTLCARYGIARG